MLIGGREEARAGVEESELDQQSSFGRDPHTPEMNDLRIRAQISQLLCKLTCSYY